MNQFSQLHILNNSDAHRPLRWRVAENYITASVRPASSYLETQLLLWVKEQQLAALILPETLALFAGNVGLPWMRHLSSTFQLKHVVSFPGTPSSIYDLQREAINTTFCAVSRLKKMTAFARLETVKVSLITIGLWMWLSVSLSDHSVHVTTPPSGGCTSQRWKRSLAYVTVTWTHYEKKNLIAVLEMEPRSFLWKAARRRAKPKKMDFLGMKISGSAQGTQCVTSSCYYAVWPQQKLTLKPGALPGGLVDVVNTA